MGCVSEYLAAQQQSWECAGDPAWHVLLTPALSQALCSYQFSDDRDETGPNKSKHVSKKIMQDWSLQH